MSVALAAGWALSSAQSVSVVPMIQCRPHGMTSSTLVSVRRMIPVVDCNRSRGTTRWMPLDARTWNWPRVSAKAWVSSVHTPVALITCLARAVTDSPVSRSTSWAPVTRSPWRRKSTTLTRLAASAPNDAAVRTTVMVCRASSTWASQYCTAPVRDSRRRQGARRSARRRLRWRCTGSAREATEPVAIAS